MDETFGRMLESFMHRRGLRPAQVAKQLGVSRQTLMRWLNDETKAPKIELIHKLKQILGLSDGDLIRLIRRTEHGNKLTTMLSLTLDSRDRFIPAEYCGAYVSVYDSTVFPVEWDTMLMDVERKVLGSIHSMSRIPPSLTRPVSHFRLLTTIGRFDSSRVEEYVNEHRRRQQDFVSKRLAEAPVRHIYSMDALEDYVSNDRSRWRDPWIEAKTRAGMKDEHVAEHLELIIQWLEKPNFEIGLARHELPGDLAVFGGEHVLLRFPETFRFYKGAKLHGLWLYGRDIAEAFVKQFDAIWAHHSTESDKEAVATWLHKLLRKP